MQKITLLILLSLPVFTVLAQKKAEKQLTSKLDRLIEERYDSIAPGSVVLVAKEGRVIYNKAFGSAHLELNVPMQPEMVFRIGSMTKQYTAVAILQLAEQGRLSLKDSIQKFIKDFPHKGHTITIENLLTHTSGIIGYEVLNFGIPNAIRIDFPVKQLIDSVAKLPLEFTPATKWNYSNTNYLLLGYIIEHISGVSYQNYLQEHMFKPIGLSHTGYDAPTELIQNRVNGYTKGSSGYRNAGYISMRQVFSAGALLSNAPDLFKWHQALHSYKLIRKESLDKAITPYKLLDGIKTGYGYGWFIQQWKGKTMIGHGGAIDGFRSMEVHFPEQDVYITALFNADNDHFFSLFENIADVVFEETNTAASKPVIIEEHLIDQYVGNYRPVEDSTQFFRIYKENGSLYMDLSNKTGMHMQLVPQSQTLFTIPVIKRKPTTIEFIIEEGKVKGLFWSQGSRHEAKKEQ